MCWTMFAYRFDHCSCVPWTLISWTYLCLEGRYGGGDGSVPQLLPFNIGSTLGLLYRTASSQSMRNRIGNLYSRVRLNPCSPEGLPLEGRGSRRDWVLIKLMAKFSLGYQFLYSL